jgi:1-aminocyclopropane-1-carboxylate deaminase
MIDTSFLTLPSPVTQLHDPLFKQKKLTVFVKRDDLIHPELQGNKWRKLKYNLIHAKQNNIKTLLTFGGAYSNHIHATAAAGKYYDFNTIGIIRGEVHTPLNSTLQDASDWGMQLHYVSRAEYRNKTSASFIDNLKQRFGEFYLIPEGGNNHFALKGCQEIVTELDQHYDTLCVDCGTGATIAGLISAVNRQTSVLGFSVLKGADFLHKDITEMLLQLTKTTFDNWQLNNDYHFGGYAKSTETLMQFIQLFKQQHNIQLEPVYSGKMFFGIYDLIRKDYFKPHSKIVAIHSGGLQGLRGFDSNY